MQHFVPQLRCPIARSSFPEQMPLQTPVPWNLSCSLHDVRTHLPITEEDLPNGCRFREIETFRHHVIQSRFILCSLHPCQVPTTHTFLQPITPRLVPEILRHTN